MAWRRAQRRKDARVFAHIPWRVQRRDKDEDEGAENQVRDRMRPVAKGGGEVQCGSSEWGHGLMAWGCWAIAVCNPVTGRDKISHPVNKAAELAFRGYKQHSRDIGTRCADSSSTVTSADARARARRTVHRVAGRRRRRRRGNHEPVSRLR